MKNPLVFAIPTAAVFMAAFGASYLSNHGYASYAVMPFCLAFVAGLVGLKAWLLAPLYVLRAVPALGLSFFVTFGVFGVRRWRTGPLRAQRSEQSLKKIEAMAQPAPADSVLEVGGTDFHGNPELFR